MMEKNEQHSHCPEVEKLMGGKMPFVTRHGITIVALVLLAIAAILCLHKGTTRQLMMDMIEQTLPQVMRVMG